MVGKVLKFGCAGLFGLFVLAMVISFVSKDKKQQSPASSSAPTVSEPSQPAAIYDVPALVGKNIDELRNLLGNPTEKDENLEPNAQQKNLGVTEWSNTFKVSGKDLLVTYNISTRKVVDFFISTDDPSGVTKDTKRLLLLGNLNENDPNYKIEYVKALKDPSSYTGVKVIPQQ